MPPICREVVQSARDIASNPDEFLDDTTIFTTAWAALKASRGQGFDPARLRPMHLVVRPEPAPEPSDQTLERTGERIREVIEARGYARRSRAA